MPIIEAGRRRINTDASAGTARSEPDSFLASRQLTEET